LKTIFEFPMALAPTLVVPIFAMVNLFVALRLIKRQQVENAGDRMNLDPVPLG
jgi:hypothetical protein